MATSFAQQALNAAKPKQPAPPGNALALTPAKTGALPVNPRPITSSVTPDMLVENRAANLITKASPFYRAAKTRGLQIANERGLANSSIAEGAALNEAMNFAVPIASQDATTIYDQSRANQETRNQFGRALQDSTLRRGEAKLGSQLTQNELRTQSALNQNEQRLGSRLTKDELRTQSRLNQGETAQEYRLRGGLENLSSRNRQNEIRTEYGQRENLARVENEFRREGISANAFGQYAAQAGRFEEMKINEIISIQQSEGLSAEQKATAIKAVNDRYTQRGGVQDFNKALYKTAGTEWGWDFVGSVRAPAARAATSPAATPATAPATTPARPAATGGGGGSGSVAPSPSGLRTVTNPGTGRTRQVDRYGRDYNSSGQLVR